MPISEAPILHLPPLRALAAVQNLQELDRFDPTLWLADLEAELGAGDETLPTLIAQLDGLHQALLSIEQFTAKAMSIRLTHVLATERAPPQLRTLLSATVISYANDMPLLRRRFARSVSAAGLEAIVTAAEFVLTLRQSLWEGVFALGQKLALMQLPWLKIATRNRSLPDPERNRLRLAQLDLQLLGEKPERIARERFEARLKTLQLPEEEIEVEDPAADKNQRFALLEID